MREKSTGVAVAFALLAFGVVIILAISGVFPTSGGGGGGEAILDEGVFVGVRPILDCEGAGITCTEDAPNNLITLNVPGAAASGYDTVEEESVPLTQRTTLNFLGTGVTCVDNGGTLATDCTIPIQPAYATVQDETVGLTQRSTLNFTGAAVSCADNGGTSATDCTITAYTTIEDEGVPLTQRTTFNIIGGALTAVDNGGVRTNITLSASPDSASVVGVGRTLTGGSGIAALGDLSADRTVSTASGETDFLAAGALVCGGGTSGRAQVHTTPLQYCDSTGTLRYAADGNSTGESTSVANSTVSLTTDVTGTLPIANGGTGQTAQTPAFDALAPTTTEGDIICYDSGDNVRKAVGTDNFVLKADSTIAACGLGWAQASQSVGRAKGNGIANYASAPGHTLTSQAGTGFTLVASTIYYTRFYAEYQVTVDQLIFEVTTASAGGTQCRIGAWAADTDNQPGALLADGGLIATDSTGVKTASVSFSVTGRFLTGIVCDGGPVIRRVAGGYVSGSAVAALGANSFITSLANTSAGAEFTAFSDPGLKWNATNVGNGTQAETVFVFVRISALN